MMMIGDLVLTIGDPVMVIGRSRDSRVVDFV